MQIDLNSIKKDGPKPKIKVEPNPIKRRAKFVDERQS